MVDFDPNVLDTLLEVGQEIVGSILDALEPVFGFRCKIFYPLDNTVTEDIGDHELIYNEISEYDEDDNKFEYRSKPDEDRRYIVLNPFNDRRFHSDNTYDHFLEDQAYIFTKGDNKIPSNSKVLVMNNRGRKYYEFRVEDHYVFNGNDGFIYIKNMLIPIS
jgi:hypothetical protein